MLRIPLSRLASIRLSVALLALLSAAACEPLLGPTGPQGVYVLETVNGSSLPAVVLEAESHRLAILADTLRLRSNGTGSKAGAQRVTTLEGAASESTSASERRINYRTRGSMIEITLICGPTELCTPPPHWVGQLTARGLEITSAPGPYASGPYFYRRISR